jgi:SPP1 family predicted phage head-tail adaptor
MIAKAPAYPHTAQLRRRGELQSVSRTKNANGIVTETWTKYADVWYGQPSTKGAEKQANKTIVEAATITLVIRYRTGVERSHRLVSGSRTFLINDVDDPENNHTQLILTCTEIVPDA